MTQHSCRDLLPLIPALSRRALRLARSRAAADDLVQETLLRLCQRLAEPAEIDDLTAYAMRVLRNEAQRSWRREATEEISEDMLTTAPDAPIRLEARETLDAIARLPLAQRRLLDHLIAGETSPARIAAETGLPLGTVMSRLARARARLRKELGRPGRS